MARLPSFSWPGLRSWDGVFRKWGGGVQCHCDVRTNGQQTPASRLGHTGCLGSQTVTTTSFPVGHTIGDKTGARCVDRRSSPDRVAIRIPGEVRTVWASPLEHGLQRDLVGATVRGLFFFTI